MGSRRRCQFGIGISEQYIIRLTNPKYDPWISITMKTTADPAHAGVHQPIGGPMSGKSKTENMALFCDFENIALGARDAKFAAFDMQKVLERLLLKGNIVVKKAYCDWERYKEFKADMHEAAFELIEIPHVRQSGKNSADIRMVVDALDLCYTKSHVDTFVIISGDSDFSPLVSKLRENDKTVIGVGVKKSTSDLFISNCDEFLYYDDFVRVEPAKKRPSVTAPAPAAKTGKDHGPSIDGALDLLRKTLEDRVPRRLKVH